MLNPMCRHFFKLCISSCSIIDYFLPFLNVITWCIILIRNCSHKTESINICFCRRLMIFIYFWIFITIVIWLLWHQFLPLTNFNLSIKSCMMIFNSFFQSIQSLTSAKTLLLQQILLSRTNRSLSLLGKFTQNSYFFGKKVF